MRHHVRTVPPPAATTTTASTGGIMKGSPGRNRARLSAVSFTPDPLDENTPIASALASRRLMTSSDRDVADARGQQQQQRSAPDGGTAGRPQGNGRVTSAADNNTNNYNNDDMRRRHDDDDDDAAVQALLRELGVEPSTPASK